MMDTIPVAGLRGLSAKVKSLSNAIFHGLRLEI
jgi:hypothetical protein